jgi:hypothetical protein
MTDHELDKICEDHQFHAHERDKEEELVQDCKSRIGAELSIRGTERHELPNHVPMIVEAERGTVSKQLLLEQGVPIEVIEKATVTSRSVSVRVMDRRDALNPVPKDPTKKKSHHKKKGKVAAEVNVSGTYGEPVLSFPVD